MAAMIKKHSHVCATLVDVEGQQPRAGCKASHWRTQASALDVLRRSVTNRAGAPSSRRRPTTEAGRARAGIFALLVISVVLAGCASSPEEKPQQDAGGISSKVVDQPDGGAREEGEAQTGRVQGEVLHPAGYPVPDVLVTIPAVEGSRLTDRNGSFLFEAVPAGAQVVRVEKENYHTLQQKVEVVAGKLTQVEVVIAPTQAGDSNEHFHDHWRGADTYTVYEGTVSYDSNLANVPPHCIAFVSFFIAGSVRECDYLDLHPEKGRIVPPGTSNITVEYTWEPGPFKRDDVGTLQQSLRFNLRTPPSPEGLGYSESFSSSALEGTFMYELPDRGVADHGHSEWTDWSFWLSYSGALHAGGEAYHNLSDASVDLKIIAHKGFLELDPPHPRFWEGGPEIRYESFSGPSRVYGCFFLDQACSSRSPNPSMSMDSDGQLVCNGGCMLLHPGQTIPPGTTRLKFSVEHYWKNGDQTYAPQTATLFERTEYVVGYKTAAAPPGKATWEDYTWLEPIGTSHVGDVVTWDFEVSVAPGEVDPYYEKSSNWAFQVAIPGYEDADTYEGSTCPYWSCGEAYVELVDMVAINDELDEAV